MPKKDTKEEAAKAAKLLAMQQPSTRALLTEDLSEAEFYFKGLHGEALVTQEAMDSGRVAKPKKMSVEEAVVAEVARKKRAGIQDQEGILESVFVQGTVSTKFTNQDGLAAKEKAKEAFMETPGTTPPDFESMFKRVVRKAKNLVKVKG